MKIRLNILLISMVAIFCLPQIANAVTDKEMEQARVIAAKAYIRYVNDGSGYLDDINPKTMDELQSALKTKEKENIKAFLAIPVPNDYAGWDKQKLVDYWAGTAFQNKGLEEKGRGGRIRARSQINKMNIAAPQSPAKPAETAVPTPAPEKKEEQGLSEKDSIEAGIQDMQQQIENELESEESEIPISQTSNNTWVYIMILAILVAIAVALVVYAANVLKKNGSENSQKGDVEGIDPEAVEKYEQKIADKEYEVGMLTKKLDAANKQNQELKNKIESLTAELAILRNGVSVQKKEEASMPQPSQKQQSLRTIYLGRANAKQIFVRADRTLNVGNSVFVLDTTDGFTGSFRVADNPAAWSLALSNPTEYLSHACVGHDLDDTENKSKIITESAGTAIFEGGCWRVIRKAKVKYE